LRGVEWQGWRVRELGFLGEIGPRKRAPLPYYFIFLLMPLILLIYYFKPKNPKIMAIFNS